MTRQEQAAFNALRKALVATIDRLERSDPVERGDTWWAIRNGTKALEQADKVAK